MFLQDLQDLGYVESRDLQMTYRSSDGYQDRLPALAEGLVRLNPDVLIAAGLDAVVALRNVTQTVFFPHFVGDACTIAVIPDRTD
jgi:putative tryptophan/tyrosine transport system substrate-binding protein